ncbi:pecanex-like protein 4 [Haliotis rubra]|uniref:pecanex-like protein 4 n=1 Tax=Haliotis rubra TaxID=36100 RepID=UPI001EE57CCD|nr:pecanex-like protein 4 [Haliotis rubra]
MGTGVPLLNDYKQEFFWKRFPQTVLGGPKFRLGYDAPAYVYLNQILLWIIPWLLGGIFTLVLELNYSDEVIQEQLLLYCCVYGACMFIFVLVLQVISTVVKMQQTELDLKIRNKKNLFAEEDEIDFESCCGAETVEFVTPPKSYKFNIFFHALVSGAMCGLTLWYLLPYTLNRLYGFNYGATAVLHIFGWLTLCMAQYSLTAAPPPEPAIFKTMDVYEIAPLMRPFYVLVCTSLHVLYWYYDTFQVANQVLHILFAVLPLLWVTGILPPVDALFLWLMEQVHVFLLGGSPMASNARLIVLLVLSIGAYLAAYFIPFVFATVVISAIFGYILSIDLGHLGTQIWNLCRTTNRISSSQNLRESQRVAKNEGFLWTWGLATFAYHFIMFAVIVGESAALNYYSQSISTSVKDILGYAIIGVCVAEKLLRDSQGVYVFFGLYRNILFPHSCQIQRVYRRRKTQLLYLGLMRRVFITFVGPLLMLAYLSLIVTQTNVMTSSATEGLDMYHAIWYTFGVVRAFRVTWQSSVHALLEMSVLHIFTLASSATVTSLGAPLLLLIIGLARDRLFQLMNKLYFFFVLISTSWLDKKQRRGSTAIVIFLSLIFFPIILAILGAAAALSAPLLPLFTLPLFFIGFPRPQKFWAEAVGGSANVCTDTVYYRQFTPQFARGLKAAFANGSLGEPKPGNHYLVRFQDRLLWLMILERGAGFCTVSVKGLELQETSCHTAEAARLDDIFEVAFEKEGGFSPCTFNKYPLHSLTPMDSAKVKTYSDARNVLTGVIDTRDSVNATMAFFVKSLVWVILHHVNKTKRKEESIKKAQPVIESKTNEEINHNHHTSDLNNKRNNTVTNVQSVNNSLIKNNLAAIDNGARPPSAQSVGKKQRKASWSSSIHSFTDSIWSDDFDADSDNRKKMNLRTSKNTMSQPKAPSPAPYSQAAKPTKKMFDNEIDDLLDDFEFGFPAQDMSRPKKPVAAAVFSKPVTNSKMNPVNHIYKPVTNLAGSPDFKCQHSSHISLPVKWRELPIEYSQLSRHIGQFPVTWYRSVLSLLDWSATGLPGEKVAIDVGADDALTNCYSQLIMACFSAFDSQNKPNGPNYLYKCYTGDVPWNAMMDWLAEDKELYNLVIKAFRYGLKLMIDEVLLGPISSDEELIEYLQDYDDSWYIGRDSDPQWSKSVLANTNNLFSLGHNSIQGTYSSRVLSLQDVMVHIGRLSPEVVRGQWANLSMELLYLTNDDEERYSIQAHPTILRNLTVQAADPPLGYPIFSSEPLTIPTL